VDVVFGIRMNSNHIAEKCNTPQRSLTSVPSVIHVLHMLKVFNVTYSTTLKRLTLAVLAGSVFLTKECYEFMKEYTLEKSLTLAINVEKHLGQKQY